MKMLTLLLGLLLLISAGILLQSAATKESQAVDTILNTSIEVSSGEVTDASQRRPYVEIQNPTGFVNTNRQPFKIADYIGTHVILLDVMTYSCINCQRTFPQVNEWYETYRDDGLVVIGIHTPEFAYEKEITNVEKAFKQFGIEFPVVLDNEYATWNALGNRFWPRMYLIDIHGDIVYDHIGEGAYDETESKIKDLLQERSDVPVKQ